MFFLNTNGFPNAKKHRAEPLICDDIVLHIFTCSSDKDFVNTEAARTAISLEYKEHFVPVPNLCDQVIRWKLCTYKFVLAVR